MANKKLWLGMLVLVFGLTVVGCTTSEFIRYWFGSSGGSTSGGSSSSSTSSSYVPGNGSNVYTFINQTEFRIPVQCMPMATELRAGESISWSYVAYKDSSDVWVPNGYVVLQAGDTFFIREKK